MSAKVKRSLGYAMLIAFVFVTLTACNKDEDSSTGTANLNVFLKSTISQEKSIMAYEQVNLDIQDVYYHASTDSAETSGWQHLETNTGIIDLLKDTAEKDTLLAFDSVLQVQTISQIRLVLGSQNSVVKDGESYNLETPSGQTSGIKVQVHAELEAEKSYKILLDFDVYESVLETGNGKFKLKPVIEATVEEQ
jgi:hypothetical protein